MRPLEEELGWSECDSQSGERTERTERRRKFGQVVVPQVQSLEGRGELDSVVAADFVVLEREFDERTPRAERGDLGEKIVIEEPDRL